MKNIFRKIEDRLNIFSRAEEDIKNLYIKEYGENDMPKANWITIYSNETNKALEELDYFDSIDNKNNKDDNNPLKQ